MSDDAKPKRPVPPQLTPWKKGQSGNPGGRPKGIAALVRASTKDGAELVKKQLAIARGELSASVMTKDGESTMMPDHKAIQRAIEWLSDRGWGKATDRIEIAGDDGGPLIIHVMKYPPESG